MLRMSAPRHVSPGHTGEQGIVKQQQELAKQQAPAEQAALSKEALDNIQETPSKFKKSFQNGPAAPDSTPPVVNLPLADGKEPETKDAAICVGSTLMQFVGKAPAASRRATTAENC